MEMKQIIASVAISIGLLVSSYAHDEGHGPKISDTGKFGGLVSGVVLKKDANLGAKAPLLHKSELVRSADGTTRLYFYDQNMAPLDIKTLDSKATASLSVKVKGKWKDTFFEMVVKNGVFIGKMPKPEAKPYNIDVVVKSGDKELLTAFDNLD
jgi:hypothetical protein